MSGGNVHTCGVTSSGNVECWGRNDYGQTNLPSGTFESVSAGPYHNCGVKTDGNVECWGRNDYGQTILP